MSKIIYKKYGQVELNHEYYADGRCVDFILQPTNSTKKILNNYGILSRPLTNGGVLLYEAADESGTQKIEIDDDLKLTYIFALQNPLFPNFTDISFSPNSSSVYYFNNLTPDISGQEHTILDGPVGEPVSLSTSMLRLTKNSPDVSYVLLTDIHSNGRKTKFNNELNELKIDLSSYADGIYQVQQYDSTHTPVGDSSTIYYNPDLSGQLPYAVFEVFINAGYDPSNPVTFVFNFKSRPTYWNYKILKKAANPPLSVDDITAATLSVQHEPDNPADAIGFDSASGTDPITIVSSDQVKFQEAGYDKLRLYKNTDILISNLPNPSAQKLDYNGSSWVSDIYVYVYV